MKQYTGIGKKPFPVFFSLCGFLIARPFYAFQTANQVIIGYGSDYLHICIGFCFPLFGQICMERLLQSTGRTDLAMIPQIVGAVFNMIFDPILIFGLLGFPRLEVMGAALATVCGQVLATIIGIVLNNILIGFTEAATAVFGAYYKIQSIIFMPIFGMNNAMVPIISYNHGAERHDRVRDTIKKCVLIAVSIMSVGTLLFECIPGVLLSLFSPSSEMIALGKVAFRTIGIHFPVAGFCIVAGSVCQALGKPVYSLITSIGRQLLVLLPAAWLLSLSGNVNLVWWAFPVSEVVSAALSTLFITRTLKAP